MNVLHGLDGLRQLPAGSVLSIGNFDGVHRGHQCLLALGRELRERTPGARLAAATFEPHPFTVLRPDRVPPRLTPPEMKRRLLTEQGVDDLVELAPEPATLALSAQEFWALLRDEVRPAHLIEGSEFTFGQNRAGTIDLLREWSAGTAVQLHVPPPVQVPLMDMYLVSVSSTLIRWLLLNGRARDAAICLGRAYRLAGPVIRGHQRGRQLGVPTANLDCNGQLVPADGVYVGHCAVAGKRYPAAISIGTLPTFENARRQIEAHLIGFAGDLYGATLELEISDWLREQWKFQNIEALKRQIACDIRQTIERARDRIWEPGRAAS